VDGTPSRDGAGALRALLHRATLALDRYWAAAALSEGLGETELSLVVHLVHAGELTPGQLAARLGLTSGGTTALIRRVEQAGGLTRAADPHDARRVLLRPTPASVERVAALEHALLAALDAVTGRRSAREHAVVVGYLEAVARATEGVVGAPESAARATAGRVVGAPESAARTPPGLAPTTESPASAPGSFS
jgi:DNA-binding MarR family transcriptional regulator